MGSFLCLKQNFYLIWLFFEQLNALFWRWIVQPSYEIVIFLWNHLSPEEKWPTYKKIKHRIYLNLWYNRWCFTHLIHTVENLPVLFELAKPYYRISRTQNVSWFELTEDMTANSPYSPVPHWHVAARDS